MKNWLILIAAMIGFIPGWRPLLRAADNDEENKLIQVLQSGAPPAEKDAACARLKFIGTSRCVPALAALLTDEELSHSARYALEPMRSGEAGAALLDALSKTTGLIRAGIINSLGAREEARAVAPLAELVRDSDAGTANAAATALGEIGSPDCVKALRTCTRDSAAPVRPAAVDGLLRSANRLLVSGQRSSALAIFEQLDTPTESDVVRVAAFTGRVRASGNAGLGLVIHAISEDAGPSQMAALQVARELKTPEATKELARLLPDLKPPVQVALVGSLAQRGDPSALPALAALADKAEPGLRLALIQAFDSLGDASVVGILASFAVSGSAGEQSAARQALTDLRRGDVTQTLIDQLSTATPAVQSELARALGARGDKGAVPKLLELAQHGPDSARKGVLQALSILADESQLRPLVELVLQANASAGRDEAVEALNSAYQHIVAERGHADAAPLVEGIEKGSKEGRAALLPICAGLADPKLRATLRIALHDQDAQVHASAVRAICDTIDPELLEDLLQLVKMTQQESTRALGINGAVRLVTQEEADKLPANRRVTALKTLLACADRPEQKRQVLAGLAEVADVGALEVVSAELDDGATQNEAARAAVKIATVLPSGDSEICQATLKKALAAASDEGTRQAVQAALKQVQDNADYLTDWEVAGPYQQADKDYAALFDIAFPPETKDAPGAKWRAIRAGLDPKRPAVMDLLKALGGQQCVAYARTWVHSDRQRQAQIEFGTDDGVKIWMNDQQVYSLNVARPLQPGSDKVNITLRPGWNPLLLKITQDSQGWEFCVRIRNPDGSHLDGLRCDSSPKANSAGQ